MATNGTNGAAINGRAYTMSNEIQDIEPKARVY